MKKKYIVYFAIALTTVFLTTKLFGAKSESYYHSRLKKVSFNKNLPKFKEMDCSFLNLDKCEGSSVTVPTGTDILGGLSTEFPGIVAEDSGKAVLSSDEGKLYVQLIGSDKDLTINYFVIN